MDPRRPGCRRLTALRGVAMTQPAGRDPAEDLRQVEEEIAHLQSSAAELRQQVGRRSDGTVEPEEVASIITSAEDLEAIADSLQPRREELRRRAAR